MLQYKSEFWKKFIYVIGAVFLFALQSMPLSAQSMVLNRSTGEINHSIEIYGGWGPAQHPILYATLSANYKPQDSRICGPSYQFKLSNTSLKGALLKVSAERVADKHVIEDRSDGTEAALMIRDSF